MQTSTARPHGLPSRSRTGHSTRAPKRSRQEPLKNRARLVVYLGDQDVAKLEILRQSVAQVRGGRRPSVGIIVSAALNTMTGELFACR